MHGHDLPVVEIHDQQRDEREDADVPCQRFAQP
jgi:hypothetical protein